MFISEQQIALHKEEYIRLIRSIEREGADIDGLVRKLESSDFFYAPASTKYHSNYAGGLCEHSLNVYHNLLRLVKSKSGLDDICYDLNSLKIVALLHDISKMNLYEKFSKNVKVYCDDGDKWDNGGKFRWETEDSYKVADSRFVYGNHEETSEYIARQFIPLKLEESVAILNHMGGMGVDGNKENAPRIFNTYTLALLLYMADMLSTYVDERRL